MNWSAGILRSLGVGKADRVLREGQDPGDLTTIEDPSALERILAAAKG